jgi:two-component system chemotaxis response regulator CheY
VQRILTVDDSVAMRQLVSATLSAAGYEVLQAASAQEALRIAADKPIDLVITDVNMPQMDGIALVRELRSQTAYRDKPLLFLTTESMAARKMEGRAAGANAWMMKPFNADRLIATIERFLK